MVRWFPALDVACTLVLLWNPYNPFSGDNVKGARIRTHKIGRVLNKPTESVYKIKYSSIYEKDISVLGTLPTGAGICKSMHVLMVDFGGIMELHSAHGPIYGFYVFSPSPNKSIRPTVIKA